MYVLSEMISRSALRTLAGPAALAALLMLAPACGDRDTVDARGVEPVPQGQVDFDGARFVGYWNRGKAELTRYDLSQARYGEVHPGYALLVFVTEEFLKEKQVKLESANRAGALPVLKLNYLRKFATGIYDYSMMGSVFTPTEFSKYPRTLKTTTSSQEWCGHTFSQFNLRGDEYRIRQFSYFEAEGDQDLEVPAVMLEDEVWTKLRLSPDLLPVGELKMFPGTFYLRLAHKPLEARTVRASKSAYAGGDFRGANLQAYRLEYPELERELEIVYEGDFPYKIAGWKEERVSGWGAQAKRLTTVARRTHSIMSPYWSQHDLKDRKLRAQLGLD